MGKLVRTQLTVEILVLSFFKPLTERSDQKSWAKWQMPVTSGPEGLKLEDHNEFKTCYQNKTHSKQTSQIS